MPLGDNNYDPETGLAKFTSLKSANAEIDYLNSEVTIAREAEQVQESTNFLFSGKFSSIRQALLEIWNMPDETPYGVVKERLRQLFLDVEGVEPP